MDKNALEPIAKAIANASIGAQPIVDSKSVRLSLPQLTQERRQELAKLVSQKLEEAKIRTRRLRDEAVKALNRKNPKTLNLKKDEIEKAMKENSQALEDLKSKRKKS